MKKDEFRSRLEFRLLWWEMEEIEPLTPLTTCNESNEVPTPVRKTKEERVLDPESNIL
jgi:hypothetical protein